MSKTISKASWMNPTEYALKEYTPEQLLDRVLWLQNKVEEMQVDINTLLDQLDRADVIINHYTKGS